MRKAKRLSEEEMMCECGEVMQRGTGYFGTDFKCDKCGKEFNGSGQRLVARSEWGEETGETLKKGGRM